MNSEATQRQALPSVCPLCGGTGTRFDGWLYVDDWENDCKCREANVRGGTMNATNTQHDLKIMIGRIEKLLGFRVTS